MLAIATTTDDDGANANNTAAIALLLAAYVTLEVAFWMIFRNVLVPRYQKMRQPDDYRVGRDRSQLFLRILERLEAAARAEDGDCDNGDDNGSADSTVLPKLEAFVREWFYSPTHVAEQTLIQQRRSSYLKQPWNVAATAAAATTTKSQNKCSNSNGVPDTFKARKDDMNEFFAWAFFALPYEQLKQEDWMVQELERIYETLESRHSMTFEDGTSAPHFRPMRLSLDPLQPNHRPLFIYILFAVLNIVGGIILRCTGFSYHRTSSGVRYWYRRGARKSNKTTETNNNNKLPLIFMHGIAPGGVTLYLPMLFFLGGDGRPLFLFENPGISFGIHQALFEPPPSEHQTTSGIWEAVHLHLGQNAQVSVVGHSFGSCGITWLIHSKYAHQIRQIVLVDPVSILLSEPDVITNFVYTATTARNKKLGVVCNELFTEHYLRRHFAWYNSELWLEDIPSTCQVLICLSELDEVVPYQKVRRELHRVMSSMSSTTPATSLSPSSSSSSLSSSSSSTTSTPQQSHVTYDDTIVHDSTTTKPPFETLIWENAGHAYCVSRPWTWHQIQSTMLRQEQSIFHYKME